ncbi:MAG: TonB-dependent receptor [Colwellia sp.]|nr:TonB-dependent receptor [Colwellia sp.]
MKQHNRNRSYLALAITAALTSNLALAEETTDVSPAAKNSGLERIEVTARRTVENLQTVPVSVTSIGAEAIAQNGITNVTDIQQYATNTTLQVSRGTGSTLTAYIRGIGQADPLWGFEPGVGIYVDDVYVARPQGGVMEILDVERIEILRGPQGTLYGKNTIGGAMKYITKKMTGDNTFDLSATAGSYGENTYKAAGQLALLDDKLYIGGAIADINRDGFGEFKNDLAALGSVAEAQAGEENYDKDIVAARLSVEYHASDDLFIRLAYDKTVDDSNAKGGHRLTTSLGTGQEPYADVYDSDISLPVANKVETSGLALTVDWNLSESLSFKSVTASREGDTYTNIDFDNTVLKSFDVPATYEDDQFTQEFQLNYISEGLNIVGGVYYYSGDACGAFDVQLETLGPVFSTPGFTLENGGCTDTESYAVYGQASIDLADQWSMTLGGRYTEDTKEADVYRHRFFSTVYPGEFAEGTVTPIDPDNKFEGEETWSHFSPRIGVEYQANDDLMLYASYADGFKSGGYNMRGDIGSDPEANAPFTPETVDTFELGFKSELTDNLRVNATLFYSDYTDMQVTVFRQTSNDNFVQRVVNAGQATISGIDFETTYAATDNLTLHLGVGYMDTGFDEFIDVGPDGTVGDQADTRDLINTPELSVNAGANYTLVADIGDFVFTANASYRSETQIFVIEMPGLDEDGYTIVNAGVSYYHTDGNWSASLQARNIFDVEARIAGYNFDGPRQIGTEEALIAYYNDPATVALTVKYEF